jgi:hypothetical protein
VIAPESRLRLRTRLDRDNEKRPVRPAMQRVALAMCTLVVLIASRGAAAAQSEIAISGTVTTRADGLSVPHAVVTVGGSNVTATSDANGRYTLLVPASLVRNKQLKLRVDALGLRPTLIEVVVDAPAVTVDVALMLDFSEQMTVGSRATRTED